MKRIGLLLAGLPLLAALSVGEPLSASAGAYWEGTKSFAPFSREKSCPVEIESAKILFSVPELPRPEEGNGACGSSVTAHYTFRNPTAEDQTARVLIPAGGMCGYASISGEKEYTVADGVGTPLNCRLRYTYLGNGFAADAVSEERREDGFFREDTATLHVSYSYDCPTDTGRAYFRLTLSYNPAKTRIAFDGSPKIAIEDGRVQAVWQANAAGGSFGYYSFGDPAAAEKLFFSNDRSGTIAGDTEGMDVYVAEETSRLGEFLEARRPAEIGGADWYNGFVDAMDLKQSLGFAFLSLDKFDASSFTKWCEYDLSVSAEGRAENVVTVPLYPSVDGRTEGETAYRYEYLLTPAQSWSDFRALEVEIRTPYYIKDSSFTFEKTDMGYVFRREGLPVGELSFILTETEDPVRVFTPFSFSRPLTVALIVLASVAAGLLTAIVIVSVRLKRKRRKSGTADRGDAREGTIPRG